MRAKKLIEEAVKGLDVHKLVELVLDHGSSMMIALVVPPSAVDALEKSGAYDTDDARTPEDPLHVTLVYLGKDQRDKLEQIQQAVTRCTKLSAEPMTASITGFAKFKQGDDGVPVVALVSCKGLEHLKVDLERALIEDGLEIPSEFGFVPHIAVRYDKTHEEDELPSIQNEITWPVNEVVIFADNNEIQIPVKFENEG